MILNNFNTEAMFEFTFASEYAMLSRYVKQVKE